jgi:hypothetical protein
VCDKELKEKDIVELKREGRLPSVFSLNLWLIGFLQRDWVCRWGLGRDFKGRSCVSGLIL